MSGSSSTTVNSWLRSTTSTLSDAGISTARLDSLVLLEDIIGKDRAWLISHPEFELQGSDLKILSTKVAQRAQHIPLAYIRGKAEFYGREFAVNEHTLVPRPESETIIELLKWIVRQESYILSWQEQKRHRGSSRHPKLKTATGKVSTLARTETGYKVVWQNPIPPASLTPTPTKQLAAPLDALRIIDIGTGSGALAITAKLELPDATVIASDIDTNCLAVAKRNAKHLDADITCLQGSLLEPLLESPSIEVSNSLPDTSTLHNSITVLLCNLPYVPDNFQINTAATHEPRHALFGGPDGLDLYRELFKQIDMASWQPSYILAESMPVQHVALEQIALSSNYRLTKTDDFIQLFEAL